jgi:hypothetical protein
LSNSTFQRFRHIFSSNKLPWIIISVGIALRLIRYLHNPSLWFDEAGGAVDIFSRSFSELIEPSPDWSSKRPYGHLILIKLATVLFGNSEFALRLIPLCFGISSLFLFYKTAKEYINPSAVPVALGLFAVSETLIFQSANLKPYSEELAYALIITITAMYISSRKLTVSLIACTGLGGAVLLWFSHSAVFVLAGAGACLAVYSLMKKDWSKVGGLFVIYLIWAMSFVADYFVYIRHLISNFNMSVDELLVNERAFIPFPVKSLNDVRWIIDTFFETFNYPVGLIFKGIAAFGFLTGCISLFRNDREKFFLLLSPIIVTLIASMLHKYPFKGRLIIFLVPFFMLFIAEGVEFVRRKISDKTIVPGVVLIAVLFVYPLSWAAYHAGTPSSREEIRPVIGYIKKNWHDGDVIYVHYYAQYAFEYYTKFYPQRFHFDENDYIIGKAPRGWYRTWRKKQVSKYYELDDKTPQSNTDIFKEYNKDLDRLKGHKRVWVLFSATIMKDGMQEEKFFLFHLDTMGMRLDSFGQSGIAVVYLYDLSA